MGIGLSSVQAQTMTDIIRQTTDRLPGGGIDDILSEAKKRYNSTLGYDTVMDKYNSMNTTVCTFTFNT